MGHTLKKWAGLSLALVIAFSGTFTLAHADKKDNYRKEHQKFHKKWDKKQDKRYQANWDRDRDWDDRRYRQNGYRYDSSRNRYDRDNYQNYRLTDAQRRALRRAYSDRDINLSRAEWNSLPPGIRQKIARGGTLPPGIAKKMRHASPAVYRQSGFPWSNNNNLRVGALGDDLYVYDSSNNQVVDIVQNLLSGNW